MQQILQELNTGITRYVKQPDGSELMEHLPPSALQLRAARLIKQVVTERDQVITSNMTLTQSLQSSLDTIDKLNKQIEELNARLANGYVSQTNTSSNHQSVESDTSDRKDEAVGSTAG